MQPLHRFYLKLLLVCLLGSCALWSCTSPSDSIIEPEQPDYTPQPLSLEVGIGTPHTRTAAVLGESFDHEAKIRLLAVPATAESQFVPVAKTYVYKDPSYTHTGTWLPLDNAIEVTQAPSRLYAHYPATLPAGTTCADKQLTPALAATTEAKLGKFSDYDSENSLFLKFPELPESREVLFAAAEVDYMTGIGPETLQLSTENSNKNATIAMKHALSMVVFRVSKAPENANKGELTQIKIANGDAAAGPLVKGSFSLEDNSFTASPAPDNRVAYTLTMEGFPDDYLYGTMVYPVSFAAGAVQVTFTVDALEYSIALPAHQWAAGKMTLYNIRLLPTEATIREIFSIKDWSENVDYEFEVE